MSTTIRIKGSELPDKWRKQANVDPDEFLRVTIEPESEREDEIMPPEERISDKLIAEVRKSEEDVKAGRVKNYQSAEEMEDDLFGKSNSKRVVTKDELQMGFGSTSRRSGSSTI